MFQERHVDSYVLALPNGMESELSFLLRRGKPILLFNRVLSGIQTNMVLLQN